jgi:hypothetical protein
VDAASLSAVAGFAECIRGLTAVSRADAATTPAPRRSGRALIRRLGRSVRVGEEVARCLEHELGCHHWERDLPHATVREHDVGPPPLLPSSATAATASVLLQLGQNVSRGGLIVANKYLVKYPIYSYLFFYGYSVHTYPRRIGYVSVSVSVSDTYPPRIQALAVVSVLHR